ncbi:hypothetical protein BLNAU_3089 [Blattamonas nauphoetae]|uniref:Protein kinase domain-containing protein n=1 Tax=Blattamonas nauphoetae TaxID=2049346 RepID=A0ABQ9YEC1_9EUKA|nr:hypothetical protein BLNAU_3089 [Blattamonas nauphoetae]
MLFLTPFCVHVLLGLAHAFEPSFDRSSPVSLSSIINDQLRNGRAFGTSRSVHFSATEVVHGHQVLISSQHLHFEGTSTPFVHTSHLELTNIALLEDRHEPSSNSLGECTFVASLLNTSLSMEGFIFHVIASKHAMIKVDSLSLTISKCTVLTEGSLSPFVISNGGGCSSSSISIVSSQYEASSRTVVSLPPLTSLALPLNNHPSTHDSFPDAFDAAVNVVHGSGLHLDDVHLGLGTGPLFDFGVLSSLSPAVPPTTISLTDSSLTNTSSLSPKTTRRLFPLARQILVSCVVERCTNHFSGTAAADVNLCGSFLASNSSFEKCSSNLDESDTHPIYTLLHRTGTNLITVPSGTLIQDVEVTRCTFKDMTSSTYASAIQFFKTSGNTAIRECSFYDCNGTSTYGGAVCVSPDPSKYSITFSSCIVVRCKGTQVFGGAVALFDMVPLTCSDCVFYSTESTQFGSALNVVNAQSSQQSTLSNSIFDSSCAKSVGNGSALCFRTSKNFVLSSLRFINTEVADARDIYCYGMVVEIDESCVLHCQSSRSSLICRTYTDTNTPVSSQDDLFQTITQETLVKSFVGSESDDGTATFTIEVEDEVTGEMVVLLENFQSTRSSPPPIHRSLTFSFPTAAKTASCTVDVGDTELIQSPVSEYMLRRASIADWLVHITPLSVSSTAVSFNDEMKTIIDISLNCDGTVQAGYSILVKTGNTERNLSLAVGSDRRTLVASGSISTLAGSVFTFSTDYTIVAVKDLWGSALVLPDAVSFTTPAEPPRLIKMTHSGLDSTGEYLIVKVRGRQMPVGTYTVELSSGGSFDVEFVAERNGESLEERDSEPASVPIYGSEKILSFDTQTSIVRAVVKSTTTKVTVSESETEMLTPAEPSRITAITGVTYDDQFTQLTLSFTGIKCTAPVHKVTVKNTATQETYQFDVNFDTPQTGTRIETIWKEEGTTKIKFGATYEVVGVTASVGEIFFESGMSFEVVPARHRLLSAGTVVFDDHRNVSTVPLKGDNMPLGNTTLKLVDATHYTETNEYLFVDVEISFTDGTDGLIEVELYPNPQLVYGHSYNTSKMTRSGIDETMFITTQFAFQMPTEPSRLEKVTPVLNNETTRVILTFEGRLFDSGEYSLKIQPTASNTDITVPLTCNEDGTLSCSITTEGTDTPHVLFGEVYTIAQITKDSAPIVINPQAKQFTVPIATLKSISFAFTNSPCTSFKLVLTTENVPINQHYTLMLKSGKSFPVTFSTSKQGETASHPIGLSDTLQYGTEYEIADLIEDSSSSPMRKQTETFTTLKRPLNFTAFVDQSSVSDDVMCGDQLNPCGSIWKAWDVAVGLKHDEITLRILKETTETQPFVVSKDMSVLIENGKNLNAVFRISASSTHSEGSGLITVNEGSLELKKVEVAVETASKSFVFLFGVNSIIVLENCVVDGVNIPLPNSDSLSVCEWKSGVIRLDNCETTIDWTKFHELPQGALHMKNGTITIDGSIFRDNTPNHDSFPSARRNIQCSDGGEVRIGTLTGGDGSQNTSSPWIALGNCKLNSTSVDVRKSLFIPILDSNKTTSNSTKDFYEVSLVGSVLMPCGLGLEVVEWDEKKKVEKRSTRMDLTGLNSSEWTETSVSFKLNRSSIKNIDHSLELHAKLSFGQNQSTDNFFLLKLSDATAKKAHTLEQAKKMMVWLIPVIVVVVALLLVLLLVLICRRKRQQKRDAENLIKNREMDPQESLAVEKYDDHNVIVVPMDADHTNNMIHHNVPNTMGSHAVPQEDTLNKMDNAQSGEGVHGYAKTKMAVRCGEELVEVPVNVNNTLYNRLHKGGPPLDTQNVFRMITRGLAQLAKHNPQMPILTRLSPMWVFLDGDTPLFQVYDNNATAQTNIPESSFFRGSEHKTMNESLVPSIEDVKQTRSAANGSSFSHSLAGQSSDRTSDGQRWMVPEVADKKVEIDTSKASVFSLGLILWEMETGLVPFGEIDAVNAQRQLGTGSLPLMDSWTNESKIELVRRCLNLDPKERPTLDEICSLLDSDAELGKPAVVKQNMEEC